MGATSKVHKFSGGRLVHTPTNLALPGSDCGGTQLGTAQNVTVRFTPKVDIMTAEEWGSTPIEGVYLDTEILLTGVFTGWDENLVTKATYGGSTGSGTPSVVFPQTSGTLASAAGSILLWLPNDEDDDPAFLAYNAIPWGTPKPVYFSGRRPAVLVAQWLCLRNGSNNAYKSDLLTNLSL